MQGNGFTAELLFSRARNEDYALHCHNEYEIYMFLEGDSMYMVEEKSYSLEPGDVIIVRKHEMHRVYHYSSVDYKRFLLMVSPGFFKTNQCLGYETSFLEENFNTGNKISAETAKKSGLYDALFRLKRYSEDFTRPDDPIVTSTMIEILYLINNIFVFENPEKTNSLIKNVLHYINNHYTSEITLDSLCQQFFVSKYHLCRIFKESTGFTIQAYIRQKRLLKVRELQNEGMSLTEASLRAGFHTYSTFYRAYKNRDLYSLKPGDQSQYNGE